MKFNLKTVKGKVMAGSVVVVLVSGTSVALASTDAGQALKNWYDQAFGQTVADSTEEAREYGEGKIPGIAEEYAGVKDDASADMDATRADETSSSLHEIDAAKDGHIESVESTKEEILQGMEKEFYDIYMAGWLDIQELGDEAIAFADDDLTQYTEDAGDRAVEQVTTDLTDAKDEAVSELEDAIENAKGELTAGLDTHGEILTGNLTNQIDFEIEEVRTAVDDIVSELVQEQQAIIASKAQELEDDAKQALDDVVTGISN
ncbi:hypothetical protein [Lentibacillus salicampi]|uniref:Uncharacterized protein n=1 Tax=Lentibacillus salicampi TaxID=175306 RepID=A0A4Y9AF20_9BACI|nr:hypothetical protein [Lentibacillus salicampi]TFJ94423.1 hypothetical protein E4U82_00460 [Lentibacillus salicampi]